MDFWQPWESSICYINITANTKLCYRLYDVEHEGGTFCLQSGKIPTHFVFLNPDFLVDTKNYIISPII